MTDRRQTRQRQEVLDAVRSRCDHPTADQLYAQIHEIDSRMSRATVYRNLHLLASEGKIMSVKIPGGERFDLRTDNHAHIVCSSCGAILDINLEANKTYTKQIFEQTGYSSISSYTVFEGFCPNCQ